ncbi:hypothetical protein W97_07146 [Coniosporium apollinis CBS 100218]|uniref:NmrA-like domain-containing protein n=1 Tax=Coniosporium apollinis (strain CBS 100218) TaxID=1168221 RepID=R7Z1S4_CONA1|nr:uncharacterized protein W97_07146 [Coniosporium apollinis CBS 100218]EON67999.1 hypothetical protein W97_07146 [Coniosporium apollinis CBS 100218]
MSSQKLITVFGATGAQGSAVVKSLIQSKNAAFKVRGITRNTESAAAKELANLGVEVIQANGFNKAEMVKAFNGSWGAFVNTNANDPALDGPTGPTDLDLGKTIVDAAAEAGVQHFIYSSFASASKMTNGAITVPEFDRKNAVEAHARTKNFKAFAAVIAGWYMENYLDKAFAAFFGGFPWTEDAAGYLTFSSPLWGGKEGVPFVSISEDFGDVVHGIFLQPERWDGKVVQVVSDPMGWGDAVGIYEKVTGKKSRFTPLPSWKDFNDQGVKTGMGTKLIFGYAQMTGGQVYGAPTDTSAARELKNVAAEAKGVPSEDAELMTIERFFRENFAQV